jgi:hypothetical protein
MVTPMKPILFAALSIAAAAAFAPAHAQYAPYQTPYPTSPARALPPSWSYDPYTSGQTSCPQKRPGDTQPCSQIMPPTYGQPSYWPR